MQLLTTCAHSDSFIAATNASRTTHTQDFNTARNSKKLLLCPIESVNGQKIFLRSLELEARPPLGESDAKLCVELENLFTKYIDSVHLVEHSQLIIGIKELTLVLS